VHAVQSAKQSQQVKSGGFQARAKVAGDFQRGAMGHALSIAQWPGADQE